MVCTNGPVILPGPGGFSFELLPDMSDARNFCYRVRGVGGSLSNLSS
ncbi:hypothetical protein [Virgibacillus sp. SK37]|nr:hypothetical protein [Virgibacillus sp. SK37]